jgi:hypothetical protein
MVLVPQIDRARVNQHPHWYLDLFHPGLLVTVLNPINVRFELMTLI